MTIYLYIHTYKFYLHMDFILNWKMSYLTLLLERFKVDLVGIRLTMFELLHCCY